MSKKRYLVKVATVQNDKAVVDVKPYSNIHHARKAYMGYRESPAVVMTQVFDNEEKKVKFYWNHHDQEDMDMKVAAMFERINS